MSDNPTRIFEFNVFSQGQAAIFTVLWIVKLNHYISDSLIQVPATPVVLKPCHRSQGTVDQAIAHIHIGCQHYSCTLLKAKVINKRGSLDDTIFQNWDKYPPRIIVYQSLQCDQPAGAWQFIETVAIPARDRLTLCISSQVGCAIGCTFCHTGTMGLTRHLEAHEVVGQFLVVGKWLKENVLKIL